MPRQRQFDLLPNGRQCLDEYGLPWDTIVVPENPYVFKWLSERKSRWRIIPSLSVSARKSKAFIDRFQAFSGIFQWVAETSRMAKAPVELSRDYESYGTPRASN